jgi:hypothetical protein
VALISIYLNSFAAKRVGHLSFYYPPKEST